MIYEQKIVPAALAIDIKASRYIRELRLGNLDGLVGGVVDGFVLLFRRFLDSLD